jgi:Kef-type K+ transport system membrane component KefB
MLGVGLMLSCAVTEWLGLHFIFGAFALGAILPKAGLDRVRCTVVAQMEQTGSLLLPLYFILAGSKISICRFTGTTVAVTVAVISVAIASKAAGAYLVRV